MRIVRLDIENFRCIRRLTLHPRDGRNLLVGPANCGKSTVLEALRLLLSPEHSYVREDLFSRFDFCGLARDPGSTIRIGVALVPEPDEWDHFPELEEPRSTEVVAWASAEEGRTIGDFDQVGAMLRVALFYQWDRPEPEDRAVAFFPKFDPPGHPDCRHVTRQHRERIGFWYAPLSDPLWDTATLSNRSQLSRAARGIGWDPLGPSGVAKIIGNLVKTVQQHSQDEWPELAELSKQIGERVRSLLPAGMPGTTSLGVTASITEAWAQRILELGMMQPYHVSHVPLSYEGTGMQRVFTVAAQEACARCREGSGSPRPKISAIDEPEVGLHPQAQQALVKELSGSDEAGTRQSFIATHSPAVLQASSPQDIWVLRNEDGIVKFRDLPVTSGEAALEQVRKNAERHWDAIAQAVYGRIAVIVEGPTEEGALPAFDDWAVASRMFEGYRGFNGEEITVVNASGIEFIPGIARVLKALGLHTVAIIDYDKSTKTGTENNHVARRGRVRDAVDCVFTMPDQDDTRDFERMMMQGTNADALREILLQWHDLYDATETSFYDWVMAGIEVEFQDWLQQRSPASTDGLRLVEDLIAGYETSAVSKYMRKWFIERTQGKGGAEQAIFSKSRRYARTWAEVCVSHKSIPCGIEDLFRRLAHFLRCGFPSERQEHMFGLLVTREVAE